MHPRTEDGNKKDNEDERLQGLNKRRLDKWRIGRSRLADSGRLQRDLLQVEP